MKERLARLWVRAAGLLVPGHRRREWTEEWMAELAALRAARSAAGEGIPGPIAFAAGALPHAMWTRTEEWTVDSVLQDVRYAGRVLRRSPGFTFVAALTLALGIGANASIFSLVNGLLFRAPAGIDQPDRLVQVARSYETDPRWDNFSFPAMEMIRREARTLSGVVGYSTRAFVLGQGVDTERVAGQLVSGDFFEVLGVQPLLGRLLQPADDVEPGAHPVAVLSEALWARRFGSDPSVIGTTVLIGSLPYEIVGVAPAAFVGLESVGPRPVLWAPLMQDGGYYGELLFEQWGASWIQVVGRLADGVSFAEASASMEVASSRLREAAPVNEEMLVLLAEGVGLDPDGRLQARQISLVLLLIVGLVLLLTCTNVANLFLARASGRKAEVGVRMALGARRGRLMRQLVTESLLVALLATALAVPAVLFAGSFLPHLFPFTLAVSVGADVQVYAFLVTVGLVAGVAFGVAPAWASVRRGVADVLREGAATGGRARTRLRDALVVAQLGLSLGLVAGAALLGRSVMNARAAQPGFEPAGVLAGFVDLQATGRYDEQSGSALYDRLVLEAAHLPGVRSATVANQTPLVGGHSRATVRPAGRDDVEYEAEYVVVGPSYFETLGIPLIRGRELGGRDAEPERVVVVNEALAAMFWPGEDAVGKELEGGWRVVGVAGDVQFRSLRNEARPAVFYPMGHRYASAMVLHVRAEAGRLPTATMLREAVSAVDPELPVSTVASLEAALTASMGETRTIGYLVAAFAALALVLAAVGLYGLVSYGAAQRVREIGIRVALGAHPSSLVRLILSRGIAISVLGVGMGLAVSWALGQALGGLLFGVAPADPGTLVSASIVLLATAALAAWLPARRASRLDAAVSLRES